MTRPIRHNPVIPLTLIVLAIGRTAAPMARAGTDSRSAEQEGDADQRTLTELRVFPEKVRLKTQRDHQSVVAQAVYDDGITRDVTDQVEFTFKDEALVERRDDTLHPAADGSTTLTVTFEGQSVDVPIEVADAGQERPISFRLDVMPVFTKAGCNTGSCHGASRGKDGFHLSLFGFDPGGDYHRLTREMPGRRINLASIHDSLILQKATNQVQHSGGKLFERDSRLYNTIARWLEAGAPDDPDDVAEVTNVDIAPSQIVLNGAGATQRLVVRAHYSDGTVRDVTDLAAFMSNNDTAATVGPQGTVTAHQRGEAFVLARFGAFTVRTQVIVLPKDLDYEPPEFPANNYIDELVADKLRKLRIQPSELCSDRVFLRRAYIDIIGKLPPPERYERFINDDAPDKREELVDELLDRKEFVEMWVMNFAELLQIRSSNNANQGLSYKATVLYYNWLEQQFADNVPMDEIASKLLRSSGGTFSNPATNFYQIENEPKKLAENVAQAFMGMRIQCAQCHNHPFDKWTMDDYYGFVSFFTQVGRKRAGDPRERIIFNRNRGEENHPVKNKPIPPRYLGGGKADVQGRDRRAALAQWMTSDDNPYFARNLANRVWAHFFGRGIVEPVDDVRISNPPSNPELWRTLGDKFAEYDYDFKKLVRDICTSRTYQLSTQTNPTNEGDTSNFSHAYIRRMRAEVLFDTISQVTQTTDRNKFRGLPRGARAVQIADGRTTNYFLTTFGRATRETVCSCEVKMEPNLSQALHLMNGPTVHNKVRQGGVIDRMLGQDMPLEQIITDLYIRCFTREPTDQELQRIKQQVADADNTKAALEDVFWALLNSKEFMFNH